MFPPARGACVSLALVRARRLSGRRTPRERPGGRAPMRRETQFGSHEWLRYAACAKNAAPYLTRITAVSRENALLPTARKTSSTSSVLQRNLAASHVTAAGDSTSAPLASTTYSWRAHSPRLPAASSWCVSPHAWSRTSSPELGNAPSNLKSGLHNASGASKSRSSAHTHAHVQLILAEWGASAGGLRGEGGGGGGGANRRAMERRM